MSWEALVMELLKYSKVEYISIDTMKISAKIARLKDVKVDADEDVIRFISGKDSISIVERIFISWKFKQKDYIIVRCTGDLIFNIEI
jgi:hypothetical protein